MDPNTIPAIPAPAGMVSNFANPSSFAWVTILTMVVYIVIVTPFVAARVYTRALVQKSLWWDDGMVLAVPRCVTKSRSISSHSLGWALCPCWHRHRPQQVWEWHGCLERDHGSISQIQHGPQIDSELLSELSNLLLALWRFRHCRPGFHLLHQTEYPPDVHAVFLPSALESKLDLLRNTRRDCVQSTVQHCSHTGGVAGVRGPAPKTWAVVHQ